MPNKKNNKTVIALTGATGFVGKRFIEIALQMKMEVRALTRRPQVSMKGVTWIEGDLNNKTALGHLVKDIDTVIHMAGVVKALNWGGFKEVNIIGTRNLIEAFKNKPNSVCILIGPIDENYLKKAIKLTKSKGAVFILDEMVIIFPSFLMSSVALIKPSISSEVSLFTKILRA